MLTLTIECFDDERSGDTRSWVDLTNLFLTEIVDGFFLFVIDKHRQTMCLFTKRFNVQIELAATNSSLLLKW